MARQADDESSLLFCIPAYNEAFCIADSIRTLHETLDKVELPTTIVVCVNGSTDGTADIARALRFPRLLIIEMRERGKGAAVRRGAQEAIARAATYFGFIDADLSADPSAIKALLTDVRSGACDIAVGSRLHRDARVARSALRTLTSSLFNALREIIVPLRIADSQCGLKIMDRAGLAVLTSCRESGWFLDIEFLWRARRSGLRTREIPVAWTEHRYPGRAPKLNMFTDGIRSIIALARIRIRSRR